MDNESIRQIVNEIAPLLIGRAAGKMFQLTSASIAIDFGLRRDGYLFISSDPAAPRLYLIKRRVRELEKQALPPSQFVLTARKELSGTNLISVAKDPGDRLVRFEFTGVDDLGIPKSRTLIAQLTGRSANILLLDPDEKIIQTLRIANLPGQEIGEAYYKPAAPRIPDNKSSGLLSRIRSGEFSSPSECADAYFTSLLAEKEFAVRAGAARAELRGRIAQQQKLLSQLESDLRRHADAEQQKRIGDLLLANLSTATREGNRVTLIDYFADDVSPITVEVDESVTLQEEAARRFGLYSRSKRAVAQITSRLGTVRALLRDLNTEQAALEKLLSEPPALLSPGQTSSAQQTFDNYPALRRLNQSAHSMGAGEARDRIKSPPKIPGTRRYLSADGLEILVGRTSKNNDHLTFKVAKPNDLWLHAADYGGSHVIVRRPGRKEIPHRTLIEAAQLAAYFSQAKKDPKVDVHYTERKFVSKPKGAKPGLVRMQRFKNITVEPKEAATRVGLAQK